MTREDKLKIFVKKQMEENPFSWDDFFKDACKGNVVEPLKKPCGDCAVESGFYTEYAEELKSQSKEVQEKVLDRWYCHNACNRGCKGAINHVNK